MAGLCGGAEGSGFADETPVAEGGVGAGEAEESWLAAGAWARDVAAEVDALSALGAGDAGAFEAGDFGSREIDGNPLRVEEFFVCQFAVGELLLEGLVFDCGEAQAGEVAGGFEGDDANGQAGGEVEEGGGHFAPVAEFEGATA